MWTPSTSVELVGREAELTAVQEWIRGLSDGPSALLVGGEAGVGKTSIWRAATHAARETGGALVLSTRPVEAELPFGYAALQDLLEDVLDEVLGDMPEPLADALSAALLLSNDTEAGEPLAVARATLSALRSLGERRTVVLAVDDVQWADPASTRALAFAVRRLAAAPVALAVSMRDGYSDPLDCAEAFGERFVQLRLEGLSAGALGHVLRARVDPGLSRRQALAIHDRSRGNPFFALELARAGGEPGLPSSLVELVSGRLAELDPPATAAAEWAAVLGPASARQFDDASALDHAISSGILVEVGDEVRFAHPLLAEAAYARLPPRRRRDLHARAAEIDPTLEGRARHVALGADGPDEEAAALLEEAAHSARGRGATESAVELIGHALRLTPDENAGERARRSADEVDYLYLAGDEPAARASAERVLASGVSGEVRVRALMQLALQAVSPEEAVDRLEDAVAEPHSDAVLAARALALLAWQRGLWLGDVESALPEGIASVELAEPLGEGTALATALTTAGLLCSVAGDPRGEGYFRRAVEIADRIHMAPGDRLPRSAYAHTRWWRGDFEAGQELLDRERHDAGLHGDEGEAMRLDVFNAELELRRGDWDRAELLLEHALESARDYWRTAALIVRCQVRGRRGDPRGRDDAQEIASSPFAAGHRVIAGTAEYALGLLDLSNGDVERAADRLLALAGITVRVGAYADPILSAIPDAVLTVVEAGRLEDAVVLTERVALRAAAGDHPWAEAAATLCRGAVLLGEGQTEAALERLADAERRFAQLGTRWELARTLLLAGNALRRAGRRTDGAGALEHAAALFSELRADPWRSRAEEELRRARPRPRRDDSLTAAESRVAALVAAGSTNKEVAAQLYTTVATVETHLTRIYRKLGIRSRSELTRAVADGRVELE